MKLEIEVTEDEYEKSRAPELSNHLNASHAMGRKVFRAYEKEKNKIQIGEWFLLTHSKIVRKWNENDDDGTSDAHHHCQRLSPNTQEILNREICTTSSNTQD